MSPPGGRPPSWQNGTWPWLTHLGLAPWTRIASVCVCKHHVGNRVACQVLDSP